MPAAAPAPPSGGPPTPTAHKAGWVALAIAVLTLLTQILGVFNTTTVVHNGPSTMQITKAAAPAATKALSRAVVAAQGALANAPAPANETCAIPAGQGAMGACAPPAMQLLGKVSGAHASSVASIPRGRPIGTDTSSFQSCLAPPAFVKFWIVKATEGTGYTDRCASVDTRIAKSRNLVHGSYDFIRATGSSAAAEAGHYIAVNRSIGCVAACLHIADVEAGTLAASTMHAYVCDWVRRVHAALGGQVVIYTGLWYWGPHVGGNNCGSVLWVSAYANYAVIPSSWGGGTLTPGSRFNPRAPLWQYSDGVYGPFPRVNRWDTDVYFGTLAQLRALAGVKAKPTPIRQRDRTACRKVKWYREHGKPRNRHYQHSRVIRLHKRHLTCDHGRVVRQKA